MTSSYDRPSPAWKRIVFFISIISPLFCFSQTHSFTTYSRISGTDLAVGALYRFTNVKAGTDALVTIMAMTGGVSLSALDNTGSGYAAAFQPTLNVPLGPNANGYVEFKIQFVAAGTSTLQSQPNIAITALDIDGMIDSTNFLPARDSLFEFDMLDLGAGSVVDFSTTGQQLKVTTSGTQITGTDKTGINYSGINTTATDVMYTVMSSSMNTFTFRTGLINKIPASVAPIDRVTSIWFGKFLYPSSALSNAGIQNLEGLAKGNAVQLSWQLAPGSQLQDLQLERSTDAVSFTVIKDFPGSGLTADHTSSFSYTDALAGAANVYYRLKAIMPDGEAQYSHTLDFKQAGEAGPSFRMYPSLLRNSTTLSIQAVDKGMALFRLVGYSGNTVYEKSLPLVHGPNILHLDGFGSLPPGNYIAVLQIGNTIYRQKIIRQ